MIQLICEPKLHKFDSCEEFIRAFQPGEGDLILANDSVYKTYFERFKLPVTVISPKKYGSGEPTDIMAAQILRDMGDRAFTRIIGIGGGTVLDLAKVLALQTDGDIDALYAAMPALTRRSGLILVPTTCGTGSEVTNISILTRTKLGTKMGIVAPCMYADHAVLIPELLKGLPAEVFATSALDALVHSVESCLSPKATAFTRLFSYKAIEMLIKGFIAIANAGNTAQSREEQTESFLTASAFAGLAFGTAGCAAVHAMAYPLGGIYHVPHGESNYALLTGVLKNYREIRDGGELQNLNVYLASLLDCGIEEVYDALEAVLNRVLPKKPLREYGVKAEELPSFTDSVLKMQGRLLSNNFVPLDFDRVLKIYRELY